MHGVAAVLHLAGIVSERGADGSFDRINVEGTRHVVEAAAQAGVRRLVYVSSLGAERGESAYHRSKRSAEELVRRFAGEWVVMRPGNVYGPGDEVISLLLKMVRVLPLVPAIDGGDHRFQPMWVEDLAEALAQALEREDVIGRDLDLAGPDVTCMNDLIERLSALTDRSPVRVPVPGFLSILGARALGLLGVHAPVDAGQIQMLEEGNLIDDPAQNALLSVFDLEPTSLSEGLRQLADATPVQGPSDGVGTLVRRHIWAEIVNSRLHGAALFERFRARFSQITPWHVKVGAEPATPVCLEPDATLTLQLPLRGNVQVRVIELGPHSVTLATLEGHPLAGLVRFSVEETAQGRLRFQVLVHDRPANIADWLVMSTVGGSIQVATWQSTVEHVIQESGGAAPDGVHDESSHLRGREAEAVEEWANQLIQAHAARDVARP
jgi:NADH dehydrogenase